MLKADNDEPVLNENMSNRVSREPSKNRLRTKNVFVDTNVHIAAKFGYGEGNFRRLAELAENGLVTVFDTRIDEGEIRAHIKSHAEHIASALKKFQREGAALRETKTPSLQALFEPVEAEFVANHLLEGYDAYQRKALVRRASLPSNAAEGVLDRYFALQAPFGEGERKSEFPDALIIAALTHSCQAQSETMYVITQDERMAEAAVATGVLFSLARLDEFLNLIVSEEHHALAIKVQRWLAANRGALLKELRESFENGGFYVEDADGDVDDVKIEELNVSEPLLVEVSDDEAVFSAQLEVTFEADLSYNDPSTGTYDNEDKVMVFMDRVRKRVRRQEEFRAEFTISFEQLDREITAALEDATIGSVQLDDGSDVAVSIEDEVVEVYPDRDYDSELEWYGALGLEEDGAPTQDRSDSEPEF